MSEQNILNPTVTSALNPDYSVKVTDPQVISRWQARSGKPFMRRLAARGIVFDLTWASRMFSDYQALRQWFSQYENDFFTYADWDFNRYYSGMFADQPTAERAGNNKVNITAQFVSVPTLPMFQYPSNWAQDAIFIEERANWPLSVSQNPQTNDLIQRVGSWDRRDLNYITAPIDFENAAWVKGPAVTPDQTTDPLGGNTADLITADNSAFSGLEQQFVAFPEIYTFSLYVRAGTGSQVSFALLDVVANAYVGAAGQILSGPGAISGNSLFTVTGLTSAWTRVSWTVSAALIAGRAYALFIYVNGTAASTLTNYIWGVQGEVAPAATQFSARTFIDPVTGNTVQPLFVPTANVNYHGGFAYFDPGTNTGDSASWMYFGYGFQLYSPKGPAMGIVQISLDTVVQGTVDLYAAALTASAPVFTLVNVPLGMHTVTLTATNTKNGASASFVICADALQVMR